MWQNIKSRNPTKIPGQMPTLPVKGSWAARLGKAFAKKANVGDSRQK